MKFWDRFADFLATGFYISRIPTGITRFKKNTGAGLFGSILALLMTPLLPSSPLYFSLFLVMFAVLSLWAARRASVNSGLTDDPKIVIDEMLGYWISIAFLERRIFTLLAAFIFFRIIDTLKPWPIKNLEKRLPNGFGIIIDDAIAGIEANILVRALLLVI
ncbi:MAG: phosphatidylglycerophosphatase A [Elusimicrobia bacterium]|nr:phosphatidylglycerophosphatase A [Elusimicrobiota bacterium]